ncbi:hypothetical protein V6Z05_00750 [Leptospira venezuelensis]|uniref:hypothetical protein n=1 Tax=Leptospira venezuelensis TaxID=1958811 RepID=UPI000A3C0CCC|nr:hypothetical protein [Leptospira venezuelensis]
MILYLTIFIFFIFLDVLIQTKIEIERSQIKLLFWLFFAPLFFITLVIFFSLWKSILANKVELVGVINILLAAIILSFVSFEAKKLTLEGVYLNKVDYWFSACLFSISNISAISVALSAVFFDAMGSFRNIFYSSIIITLIYKFFISKKMNTEFQTFFFKYFAGILLYIGCGVSIIITILLTNVLLLGAG